MKSSDARKDIVEFLISFICTLAIYLSNIPGTISGNNLIYAIGQIHAYNTSVFNSNVYMADGAISPRYVVDTFFAFLMKLNGGNWVNVAVPFVYASIAFFAIATTTLAFRLSKENRLLFSVVIAIFFVLGTAGQIGGFPLLGDTLLSIGMGMGYAFAVFAIAFAVGENKNFNIAWVLLAVSVMMHIHEGIYGFGIVFILFLVHCIGERTIQIKRNWTIIIFVVAVFAVVIPNFLTDSLTISNQDFVYIYAMLRTPHHLVPSTWNEESIRSYIRMIYFPAVLRIGQLYFQGKTEKIKYYIMEAVFFLSALIGVLVLMYVGIERLWIVSVVTIFPSKFFKYVKIISWVWYIRLVRDYLAENEYFKGFSVLAFAITAQSLGQKAPIICVGLLIWLYYCYSNDPVAVKKKDWVCATLLGILCALVAALYPGVGMPENVSKLLFLIVCIFVCIVFWEKTSIKIFRNIIPLLLLTIFLRGAESHFYEISGRTVSIKTPTDFLIETCGADIYELANTFGVTTEEDEEFLADPYDDSHAGWLQVISERNCYVLYKVIPSSKATMQEWYNRYQTTQYLFDKDTAEIVNIMRSAGTDYLLVSSDYYEKIESSGDFSVYTRCSGDTYRVYKVAEP